MSGGEWGGKCFTLLFRLFIYFMMQKPSFVVLLNSCYTGCPKKTIPKLTKIKILERSGLAVKSYHPETLAAEE